MHHFKPGRPPSRRTITRLLEQETAERLSRIDAEFNDGYKLAHKYNDTITVFGSARYAQGHPHYEKAVQVAEALSRQGFTIVTGGGPGIMEAANKGAWQADCPSVGLSIDLPHEQGTNQYVTDSMSFRYFFSRKVMLAFGAQGYLFFPGGFGTLDELFEIITLIQTGKMPVAPVILVGTTFWRHMDAVIKLYLLEGEHTISPGDENIYTITDSTEEIVATMNRHREATIFQSSDTGVSPIAAAPVEDGSLVSSLVDVAASV
jgi:uncharacterized protein (TIGR00730 family)